MVKWVPSFTALSPPFPVINLFLKFAPITKMGCSHLGQEVKCIFPFSGEYIFFLKHYKSSLVPLNFDGRSVGRTQAGNGRFLTLKVPGDRVDTKFSFCRPLGLLLYIINASLSSGFMKITYLEGMQRPGRHQTQIYV